MQNTSVARSFVNNSIKNLFTVAFLTALGHLLSVLLYPIAARYLSEEDLVSIGLIDSTMILLIAFIGFGINEIQQAIKEAKQFKNIKISGLMGMATFTDNTKQIAAEFQSLKDVFDRVKNQDISILSIGMSGDYKIAIEKGSTMIRIGSAIFGSR